MLPKSGILFLYWHHYLAFDRPAKGPSKSQQGASDDDRSRPHQRFHRPSVGIQRPRGRSRGPIARRRRQDRVARSGANPLPHLNEDSTAAIRGAEPANDAQKAARALSDAAVAEIKAADLIVIGSPMYNFGISSTLKSWFDHIARAGVTFSYSEAGPKGLLTGKRALVIESRAGMYSEGPAKPMDSQEPYLRTVLGFLGITDVTFVRVEKLAFGPEARDASLAGAKSAITAWVGTAAAKAA